MVGPEPYDAGVAASARRLPADRALTTRVSEVTRTDTDEHVELLADAPDDPTAQGLVDQVVHAMRLGVDDG